MRQSKQFSLSLTVGTGTRPLLSSGDFTFLGSFDVQGNVAVDLPYGSGFTHRYVGGQLRFLTSPFNSYAANVVEFAPVAFGGTVNALTNTWNEVFPAQWRGGAVWRSIWWDEANQRLINTVALDYPQGGIPLDEERLITVGTLNADGSVTQGSQLVKLQGIGQRAVVGGLRKIPAWFSAQHGVGPYLAGFGGYTSLMGQGLVPSLGPFFAAIPDPAGFASSTEIPASQISVLADCRSGSVAQTDWYPQGQPTTFDRGVGSGPVTNYYDSGENGVALPPTVAPTPPAYWQSPAPDGLRRWVWGDSHWSACDWIDNDAGTRAKHGLVTVATLATGKAYYMDSTLNCDGRVAEIHVYDPADLAAVKAGTLQPWAVRPKTRLDISSIIKQGCDALRARNGSGPDGSIGGATYDATTGILWLMCHWAINSAPYSARVYAFQVG